MKKISVLAFSGLVSASLAAQAAPILPAQDKAGDVNTYQALAPADRMATLEAFTGKTLRPGDVFDNLDACTLRATTEPSAGSMRLSKVIPACEKELGY